VDEEVATRLRDPPRRGVRRHAVEHVHAVDAVPTDHRDQDGERATRLEQSRQPGDDLPLSPEDGGQQRPPREVDADLVRRAGQLVGEGLG
jgi:hypothetical protein